MRVRRLAWGLLGLCVGLTAAGLVFAALNRGSAAVNTLGSPAFDALFSVVFLAFPIVGALIATRQPRNAIGWLFLATGLGRAVDFAFLGYATHTLVEVPGSLPGGALAALVADLAWVPSLLAATALLFLLFPHGRLPSRRWRPFVWLIGAVTLAYVVATAFNAGPLYYFPDVENPLGLADTTAVVDARGRRGDRADPRRRRLARGALPAFARAGAPAAQVAGLRRLAAVLLHAAPAVP